MSRTASDITDKDASAPLFCKKYPPTQQGMEESDFMRWTLPQLREFLADRDVKNTGDKRKLVELAYKAYTMNIQVTKVDELEYKDDIKHNLDNKLRVDGVTLPDPSSLRSGWTPSPLNLPETTYDEVDKYLNSCRAGKAYKGGRSLLDSNHLSNVMIHTISPSIRFCFVRGNCLPEQRLTLTAYDVWALVHKDTGNVLTGNCSCAAGAAGFCKHLGCLLWHIEKEVRLGNNRTATSKTQQWSIPSKRQQKIHLPEVITNIKIKKPKIDRVLTDVTPSKKERHMFDPRAPQDRYCPKISQINLDLLAESTNGNCGLVMLKRKSDNTSRFQTDVAKEVEIVSTAKPISIEEIAMDLIGKDNASFLFHEKLTCSKEEQECVQQLTAQQQKSDLWYTLRKDRITASNFKSAVIKGRSCVDDFSPNTSLSFVKAVCGYNKQYNTKAMRWGSQNEDLARKSFTTLIKKCHKKVKVTKCGLFISTDHPFLGASPDGLICCECHGEGLLEIKCPWKYRGLSIKEYAIESDSCLMLTSDGIKLKQDHQYWYQVQCQMGVTQRKWCHFYLTTTVDFHLETIQFDEEKWPSFVEQSKISFDKFILPEILSRTIRNSLNDTLFIKGIVYSLVESALASAM